MSKSAAKHGEDDDASEENIKEVEEEAVVEDTTLANSDVMTKHQEAARIANTVMKELIATMVPGVSALDVCKTGDRLIDEKLDLIYRGKGKNGKPVDKGIAFPVCVSINEVVCHYSPLDSDTAVPVLNEGDHVKIDLGVHIDGYIAVIAHTIIIPSALPSTAPSSPISGSVADVYNATYIAAELATRLIRPGNTNQQVTEALTNIGHLYGVNAISGTVMHQMKRYVIDGNKKILVTTDKGASSAEKVELVTFEPYEVYAVDVAFTTGDGKPKDKGLRTTVYKRIIDHKYGLKVKASRTFFNEVNKRFPTFPFSLRYISDEKNARLGLRECVDHELLGGYPILAENKGDYVAHFKFTVLVLPTRTVKVTGLDLPEGVFVSSDKALPDDIAALLAAEDSSLIKKKNKKNKKKAAGVVGAEPVGAEEA